MAAAESFDLTAEAITALDNDTARIRREFSDGERLESSAKNICTALQNPELRDRAMIVTKHVLKSTQLFSDGQGPLGVAPVLMRLVDPKIAARNPARTVQALHCIELFAQQESASVLVFVQSELRLLLQSGGVDTRIACIRAIVALANQPSTESIGTSDKTLRILAEILHGTDSDPRLVQEAALAIGALAETIPEVIEGMGPAGITAACASLLSSPVAEVQLSCLNSLRWLTRVHSQTAILVAQDGIPSLQRILKSSVSEPAILNVVMCVERICAEPEFRRVVVACGIIQDMIAASNGNPRVAAAVCRCLVEAAEGMAARADLVEAGMLQTATDWREHGITGADTLLVCLASPVSN